MKQTDATNGAGSSAATTPTINYPVINVRGMFPLTQSLDVHCNTHPDRDIGKIVCLSARSGCMSFQFDMRPEQVEELVHALTKCAAFMRGLS